MDHATLQARLPAGVADVAARLRAAGGRAWLVGGTARDLLLASAPRDVDLATDLPPDAVAAALPGADTRDTRFGVVRVREPELSVTTLRRERGYRDRRRPDEVEFVTDVAIDAVRRDFTVNALYVDLADGAVADPTGGLADLQDRRLAAIGDPVERLHEDPLRLLRLVRLAARCELTIAPATANGARATAAGVLTVAPERAYAELTDAFTGAGRGRALRLLVELGIAAHVLPEVAAMAGVTQPPQYHPEGDVLTHVALVLDHVPAGSPELAWSAVLHDAGKPPTWRQAEDRIRFDGHDVLSAEMADAVLRRLRAPGELREAVVEVARHHLRFAALPAMRPARAERWLRDPRFPLHLAFHRADCLGSHGNLEIHEYARRRLAALPPEAPPPLLGGKDVLALGVAPGPEVGELLRAAADAIDESPAPLDRAAALVLLRELVAARRQGGEPTCR
jgi:poly(A) polymerase